MFRTDRAVKVLAHIHLSKPVDDDKSVKPGTLAWNQGQWGEISVTDDQISNLFTPLPEDNETWYGDGFFVKPGGVVVDDSCGTAGCLAGWALMLSGVQQAWLPYAHEDGYTVLELQGTVDGRSVHKFAIEWLGIEFTSTFGENWPNIFKPSNDYDDLLEYVANYADLTVTELEELVDAEVKSLRSTRSTATRLVVAD